MGIFFKFSVGLIIYNSHTMYTIYVVVISTVTVRGNNFFFHPTVDLCILTDIFSSINGQKICWPSCFPARIFAFKAFTVLQCSSKLILKRPPLICYHTSHALKNFQKNFKIYIQGNIKKYFPGKSNKGMIYSQKFTLCQSQIFLVKNKAIII